MKKYKALKNQEMSLMEKEHMEIVRKMAAECMVLLENDGVLPLTASRGNIALYGNGARRTVKGGTGSGDVNSRTVINIEQGLEKAGFNITTKSWLDNFDKIVASAKEAYLKELDKLSESTGISATMLSMFDYPFREPQVPLITKEDVDKSDTDTAIYVIGRISGEGKDRCCQEGDYLLYANEIENIKFIAEKYKKCIVLLNTGGVIDTKALKSIRGINAIMYVGQAGNITGLAVADALLGITAPSGKLADTWALDYWDYPSSKSFSLNDDNDDDEYYTEGIYVGYRYFDTFNVTPSYCFGYGKSYTEFEIKTIDITADSDVISLTVKVTNTGNRYSGKEVVQVYYSAPKGDIEKPYQELAAFAKTKLLAPGESQVLVIEYKLTSMASYSEKKAAWIMEAGEYLIRVGNSSRNTRVEGVIVINRDLIISKHENLFRSDLPFEISSKGKQPYSYPTQEHEKKSAKRIIVDVTNINTEKIVYKREKPIYCNKSNDRKFTMDDVMAGNISLEDLVAQLTVEEMANLCVGSKRGEKEEQSIIGNASNIVPGAAGDTTSLLSSDRKIPNMIMADGPAGLRLNPHFITDADGNLLSGGEVFGEFRLESESNEEISDDAVHYYQYCTALPVASLLASSWDMDLIEKAGDLVGKEMLQFGVTLWLAPGMNIHRNPLCGRNFEYYSEDPLFTGMCASAITKGVQKHPGIGTTIKHFAANNQENNRFYSNSHVSERALREIYLKGFEIAVKTSQPMAVMSSYNLLNGVHTANSYELLTSLLRDEWGFKGLVMTDWFATHNTDFLTGKKERKYPASSSPLCIKAGNDLIMPGGQKDVDEIIRAVYKEEGEGTYKITLEELQYCALNILRIILQSSCYENAKPYIEQFGELPWVIRVNN